MILIDMKMPDCCYRCPACSYLSWWCDAMNKSLVHAISDETRRAEWCPIKELPPHGRLIDADALMQMCGMAADCYDCQNGEHGWCKRSQDAANICKAIEDAPTIIPADKEET